jgi:hypothetical protein
MVIELLSQKSIVLLIDLLLMNLVILVECFQPDPRQMVIEIPSLVPPGLLQMNLMLLSHIIGTETEYFHPTHREIEIAILSLMLIVLFMDRLKMYPIPLLLRT